LLRSTRCAAISIQLFRRPGEVILSARAGQTLANPEQRARIARLDAGQAAQLSSAATQQEGKLMGIIIWLIVGGVCGWLASMIMRTDAQQGIILNIIVGIVGAAIAGFLLGGGADMNHGITIQSFLYSLLGAVVLLAIVNLIRRGTVR
jgi:uncharacterized membrane protein YeaQ/YmgE (transglycosylase-associated protein family)